MNDGEWTPGPNGFDLRAWVAMLRRGWTAQMVKQLPDAFRFEIIDGELLLPEEIWKDRKADKPRVGECDKRAGTGEPRPLGLAKGTTY